MNQGTSLLSLLTGDPQTSLIEELRSRVALLESERTVGNITYGGPLKTTNAPNVYTVGPFVRDFDSSFPAEFDLLVPDNLIRLIRCKLRLKPRPIRLAASVTSTGSGTLTSDSGGGSTSGSSSASTSGSTTHQHSGSIGSSGAHQNSGTTANESNPGDPHNHIFATDSGGNHTHSFATDNETAHTHGISHTHSTPNHQHTIPSHTHGLTLGISEGGSPANVRLYIDNVDRSAALGGPWGAAAEVDITQYLVDSKLPPEPVAGVHPIKFTTTSVGAIEAFLDFYCIVAPVSH